LKNECRGGDPTKNAATKHLVDRGPTAEYGQARVFTLIDTNTMFVIDQFPAFPLAGS
jgi:hypothetical protein